MNFGWTRAAWVLASVIATTGAAQADRIKNPTAVFSGLDKITGRIVSFEVKVDETVQFGALQMTPRVCFTKPQNETPNTSSFVEVEETGTDGKVHKVFSGWMFASSPGLHGIEHPVYDIWLVDCKGGTEVIAEPKEVVDEPPPIEPGPQRTPAAADAPARPGNPGNIMAPAGSAQPLPPAPTLNAAPPQPRQRPTRNFNQNAPIINTDR